MALSKSMGLFTLWLWKLWFLMGDILFISICNYCIYMAVFTWFVNFPRLFVALWFSMTSFDISVLNSRLFLCLLYFPFWWRISMMLEFFITLLIIQCKQFLLGNQFIERDKLHFWLVLLWKFLDRRYWRWVVRLET